MSGQKRILLVSRDSMVLQTRKLMLGTFFDVNAAGRPVEAIKALKERTFDLIVLCYTLTDDDCESIMNAAHEHCPDGKILMLTARNCPDSRADTCSHFPGEEGPYMLIKKSAEILGLQFEKSGRVMRASQPPLFVPSQGAESLR
jgi:response regulator RpfG family c-di-GMP phosphodiesterase